MPYVQENDKHLKVKSRLSTTQSKTIIKILLGDIQLSHTSKCLFCDLQLKYFWPIAQHKNNTISQ